ncbi:hypothetical protein [Flavobacterium sp.]|uniref:hypothetical protein n=1 Tax=Flavobacterium sp. TaxID=239 RepID=UPI002487B090|nr:hypothetical protein [Flavobacterium sp.]MDI1316914.1 hypothetical protein [Flavobacterium sp.]
MNIDFNLHKIIGALNQTKVSFFTVLITFLSSYNLWYLSIYFFNPTFIIKNGTIITLMTTFSLTICWYLISIITIPKEYILVSSITEEFDKIELDMDNKTFKLFTFAEIIMVQSFFNFLVYIFNWNFLTLISISFSLLAVKYIFVEIFLKKEYFAYKKRQNNERLYMENKSSEKN